jgi:crotonobetainyl-CoA:carnitine CoA-transferase CaiB-like acyl-CoA transferase
VPCEAINQKHLIEDPRFDSFEKRRENENELYAILEDVFDKKTTEEWFEIMREHGVPSGPVYDTLEMWNDPYIDERKLLKELANPSGNGTLPVVGYPVTFESHETTFNSPPRLGEDSEEILESLGFSEEEISRLRDQQTI